MLVNKQQKGKMNTLTNVGLAVSTLPATLRRAAELAEEIATKQNELNQLLAGNIDVSALSTNGATSAAPSHVVMRGTRKFTPEGIARIQAAQAKRWKNKRKADKLAAKAAAAGETAPATAAPAPAVVPATPVAASAPIAQVATPKAATPASPATPVAKAA